MSSSTTGGGHQPHQQPLKPITRRSILSDPRLSQLFQLSSQLEDLANSIEVRPVEKEQQQLQLQNNNAAKGGAKLKTPNGNQPLLPLSAAAAAPKPTTPSSSANGFNYRRLEDSERSFEEEDEYQPLPDGSDQPPNPPPLPPPPRYSTVSDSCMSTSSQADSTTTPSSMTGSGFGTAKDPPAAAAVEDGGGDAWQARCVELEWSLQKFREQAQNIREMLRDKVGYAIHVIRFFSFFKNFLCVNPF